MENPFTPSFGTVPYVLAGRDRLLQGMQTAFERKGHDPLLSSLLIGARGTGKTALLSCIREEAERAGWLAVGTVALPGLLEDIFEQACMAGEHLIEEVPKSHITSLTVGPLSIGWETQPAAKGNWRTRMGKLLDQLGEYGTGLLITIDEARVDLEEIVQLAAVYQQFVTEGRRIALVMAGLPYQVHRLVTHKSISFLRRASQHELGAIGDGDVRDALRKTFAFGGKAIDGEVLDLCVDAIGGFPYLLQLVGYKVWDECGEDREVSKAHARRGIEQALAEMDAHVLAATYRELSPGDLRYLKAMLLDRRESRTSEIAKRMGVTSSYASKYRARLLAQGIIREEQRGWVAFEIPGFREYLSKRLAEEEA